ncbi:MAG TPA: hypothetical protein PKW84_07690, partial [Fervidobacterium sp.]|nr:hypothetical protein [Fervidobacterium sp.]
VYDELNIGDEISGKIIKLEQQKDIYKIIVSPKVYENEKVVAESEKSGTTSGISLEEKLEDGKNFDKK